MATLLCQRECEMQPFFREAKILYYGQNEYWGITGSVDHKSLNQLRLNNLDNRWTDFLVGERDFQGDLALSHWSLGLASFLVCSFTVFVTLKRFSALTAWI